MQAWKELLLQEFGRWLVTPGDLGWNNTLEDIWNRYHFIHKCDLGWQ